jgi:hypothetical protein
VPSPPRDRRNGVKASVYLTPVSDSEALQKELRANRARSTCVRRRLGKQLVRRHNVSVAPHPPGSIFYRVAKSQRKKGSGPDRDRSRWLTHSVSRAPEHGVVRQTERERRLVDQTGIEPVTS